MIYLLLLITTASLIATEDYPAIIATLPDSPKLTSKKSTNIAINLLHAHRWEKDDFDTPPQELKDQIKDRVMYFAIFKNFIEKNICTGRIKKDYQRYLKWFYPHHGNLMMWSVNEAVQSGDNGGFLDFFVELVRIPALKTKKLLWQELDEQGNSKEISGTIAYYIGIYKSQIMQTAPENVAILQEFLDKLSPAVESM